MPAWNEAFKICPRVEFTGKKMLNFEDAADLLSNAVGCQKISSDSAKDFLKASGAIEVPGVSLVSFRSIEQITQSLRDEWITWPKKLRLKRSPFFLVSGRLEINLNPVFLGDLGLGLRGLAGTLLHRWVEELQCIPLGFKELTPVGKHGAVVGTSPFVHFYIHFKAIGFAPKKGDWLRGQVCEVQIQAGLNVTLVGLANCHISSDKLPKSLRFCTETQRWLGLRDDEDGEEPPKKLAVYVRVEDVELDKFHQSGKMFEIKVRLGHPEEDMPRMLKEAQAAEKLRAEKRLERLNSKGKPGDSGAKNEDAAASPARPEKREAVEDATASSGSKKTKKEAEAEEAMTSSASKKKKKEAEEEEAMTSSASKKKKEAEEEEAMTSSASKKKKKEAEEEEAMTSSASKKKKKEPEKEDVVVNGNKLRGKKEAKRLEEAVEAEDEELVLSAKQKRGAKSKV